MPLKRRASVLSSRNTAPRATKRIRQDRQPSKSGHLGGDDWSVNSILTENKDSYWIAWEGIDPVTKKPWPRTWEPKGNVNAEAIADWEQKKDRRQQAKKREQPSSSPPREGESTRATPLPTPTKLKPTTRSRPPSRTISDSSLDSSSPAGILGRRTVVQETQVVAPSTRPTFEVRIPNLSTQRKEEYSTLGSLHVDSLPSHSSGLTHSEDSGIGSISPVDRNSTYDLTVQNSEPGDRIQQLEADKESLISEPVDVSNFSASTSKRISQPSQSKSDEQQSQKSHSRQHLIESTTESQVEDESRDSPLFIPDTTRPGRNYSPEHREPFVSSLPTAYQEEVDLNNLSPLSPSRILATHVSRSSSIRHSSHSPGDCIQLPTVSDISLQRLAHQPSPDHITIGRFSQNFSTCENRFETQVPHSPVSSNLNDTGNSRPPDSIVNSNSAESTRFRKESISSSDRQNKTKSSELNSLLTDSDESNQLTRETVSASRRSSEPILSAIQQSIEDSPLLNRRLQRHIIPTDREMSSNEGTPGSKSSLRERLRMMREATEANFPLVTTEVAGSSTPSGPPTAIPDRAVEEPLPDAVPPLTQSVVLGVSTLDDLDSSDAMLLADDLEQESNPIRSSKLGTNEFALGLTMEGIARDAYQRIIRESVQTFTAFLSLASEKSQGANALSEQMEYVARSLRQVLTNNDLNIKGTATQHPVTDATEASWSEYTSPKFYFLRQFFSIAHGTLKRVCIMAEDTRLLDLIERYLKGRNIVYTRLGKPRFEPPGGNVQLNVDLLRMADLDRTVLSKPDLIIAFDTSFDSSNPAVKRMRGDIPSASNPRLTPVVHLLVLNSIEHIEHCLPATLRGLKRQQALMRTTLREMHHVGGDPERHLPAEATAMELVEYLHNPNEAKTWNLAQMDHLELELNDSTQESPPGGLVPLIRSESQSRSITPGGQKRQLTGDQDLGSSADLTSSKRQRLTPLADITHISDSVHGSQYETALLEAQQALVEAEKKHQRHIYDLRANLETADAKIQELQDSFATAEKNHNSMLGKLQHRFEARTTELGNIRKERDELNEKISTGTRRSETLLKENVKLKEERALLQTDLQSVRSELKGNGGPLADLEAVREELRTATKEKASLEKKVESIQRDFDFTRQQYQIASTSAVESAGKVTELEVEIAELTLKAENKAAQFRSQSASTAANTHLARVIELENLLSSREELLKRKEEEVRELKKGRGMGTRASSVQPRSPRLGNSRPVSPAPGNFVPVQPPRGGSALRFGHEMR